MLRPFTTVLIIPTGIGATIGGYAGDGLPVARAIAAISDRLITHPNVLNGALLYWPLSNALYVEGFALDRWAAGEWGLRPVRQNRVGLLLDQGIEPSLRLRHLQAADAARATLGLTLTDYVVTDAPLEIQLRTSAAGASWGTLSNPGSLLRAAQTLIHQAGAEAIAVVARFPDEDSEVLTQYRQGSGVDALAGAEAVISHLIVREFKCPAAHAPALGPLPPEPSLAPRAAAEELGYTFLSCVLVGLSQAPQFVQSGSPGLWSREVDALVLPQDACGGAAALSFANQGCPIVTVKENQTAMTVPPTVVGMQTVSVDSYWEALGVLAALKAGINPSALRSHLPSLVQRDPYL